MTTVTTRDLHEAADQAAQRGDFWMALRHAADVLAAAPHDHRARLKVGLSLAALDQTSAAVEALVVGARDLAARGYLLSALAMARDALALEPEAEGVWNVLRDLHQRAEPGGKPRVPPPVAPLVRVDERAFQEIDSRDELVRRAAELSATPPDPPAVVERSPLPLFGDLDFESFRRALPRLELKKLPPGATVVHEGDVGDALFMVVRGEVEVLRGGRKLAVLPAGSYFGELSLFLHKPRSATVRTTRPTEMFALDRSQVEALAQDHPPLSEELATFARRRLLANVLATSPIFEAFGSQEKREMLARFRTVTVPSGHVIIREGTPAESFFVVAEGQVQVTMLDAEGEPLVLSHLGPGEVFGEIAIIHGDVTRASVAAVEATMLLQLDKEDFADFIRDRPEAVRYLEGLSEARLSEIRSAAQESVEVIDADELIVV